MILEIIHFSLNTKYKSQTVHAIAFLFFSTQMKIVEHCLEKETQFHKLSANEQENTRCSQYDYVSSPTNENCVILGIKTYRYPKNIRQRTKKDMSFTVLVKYHGGGGLKNS